MTSYERVAKPVATVAPPQISPVAKPLQRWPQPAGLNRQVETQAVTANPNPELARSEDPESTETELQRSPYPGFDLSKLHRTPASGPIHIHAGRIQPQPLVQAECAHEEEETQSKPDLQRQPVSGADAPLPNPNDQPQPMGPNAGVGGSSTTFTPNNTTRTVHGNTLTEVGDAMTNSGTREAASVLPKLEPAPQYTKE
jgi:hypothetical protein